LDECGADNSDAPSRAYGLRGKRVPGEKRGHSTERVSIIGALNQNQLQAPLVFTGYCDRPVFETYLKEVLIPTLSPGYIVVLDNASFHKGGNIKKLINAAGCELEYLPAYSPDLNPIEHHWFPIKHAIKNQLAQSNIDLFTAAEHELANKLS